MTSHLLTISCAHCRDSTLKAKASSNFQHQYLADIEHIKCTSCSKYSWACVLCSRSWKLPRQNARHVETDVHKQAAQQNSQLHPLGDGAEHQPTGDDDDWVASNGGDNCMDIDSDAHQQLLPLEGDHSNNSAPTNDNRDWLTSIDGQLGSQATSLEAIVQGGGFPPESKSPEFYYFEAQWPGQGAKYLAAKPFDVSPEKLSNKEAEFHLRITKFLTRLTKTDQEELAYCMLHAFNARDETLNIFHATRPPTSTEDFNEFYMGGKKSVTKHLPTPVVNKTADNNHSYVTLTDVIQNMLAASASVDQFQFETNMQPEFFDDDGRPTISKTRAAYSLFLDLKKEEGPGFVLYLWIKRWCDDFDPNNTKQSRNQVWLMTNTICPPRDENKGRNTCFMAIGQKGDDHQEIDQIFEKEMRMLSVQGKTFYHGGRKEFIRVKAGTVCVCVDRPERASLYQVGDHTGTFSTLWGHAVDVDGKCEDNCLPSCPFCRRQRLMNARIDSTECPNGCVSWEVMDSKFTSKAPAGYPTVFDDSIGAPHAPSGREISTTGSSRLPCIYLTIPWLKQAVIFAHHQLKTRPPKANKNKRFWSKQNSTAYLRTCGINSKLYEKIFESAKKGDDLPPMPYSWGPERALQSTHFAAMHMLFLGHGKSNYDMVNKFHASYNFSATVGKQANKYLRDVQALRCNRFFDAQPLSTSTWGTGVWVSENYLFWVRTVNFFCTLPSIVDSKHATKPKFQQDVRMLHRFCSSSLAAISRIMSDKKTVGDMDNVVKIYLDTMVEMDRWLYESANGTGDQVSNSVDQQANIASSEATTTTSISAAQVSTSGGARAQAQAGIARPVLTSISAAQVSNTDARVSDSAAQVSNSAAQVSNSAAHAISSAGDDAQPSKKRKKKMKHNYNFCKSNSLGILAVAEAHRYLGPAMLHWEGGWAGERKIQQAKPLLSIKRATADWRRIVLENLWRENTLSGLIERMNGDKQALKDQQREIEGLLKVYSNLDALTDAIASFKPLSGMLAKDGTVWAAYRPTKEEFLADNAKTTNSDWSRSSLQLLNLEFDDGVGQLVSHLCWFSPLSVVHGKSLTLGGPQELKNHVDQYVLLLPKLGPGDQYINMFYVVGSKWTERVSSGLFEQPQLSLELFKDWQTV